jgi:hypothetical protein
MGARTPAEVAQQDQDHADMEAFLTVLVDEAVLQLAARDSDAFEAAMDIATDLCDKAEDDPQWMAGMFALSLTRLARIRSGDPTVTP